MLLFDALDKMQDYNEAVLLKKTPSISKGQLSNIKAQLYRQILNSLRTIRDEENIDMQLHELMDHARILYNKGLHLQALKILERFTELARTYQQVTYLQQALLFEKKIESLYITRSMQNRANQLTEERDKAVSYTHLDVYKRQVSIFSIFTGTAEEASVPPWLNADFCFIT